MGYIIINFQSKSKFLKSQNQSAKVIIKDGCSLLTYADLKQTKATFEAMRKDGKKCDMRNGMIVEYYEGKKAGEIKDMFEKDILKLKEKYKQLMDINYSINFIN